MLEGIHTSLFGILRPLGLLLLGLALSPVRADQAGPVGPDNGELVQQKSLEQLIANLPLIRSCAMNVHYQVNMPAGQRPARVELWYCRQQRGDPWQLYDYDEDCVSPIRFVAPGEGIFQFLVVAVDRLGRRSANVANSAPGGPRTPTADRPAPQQEVFVDYTTPRLILQNLRQDIPDFRRKQLDIRWAGFDAHLAAAPVRLYYRSVDGGRWIMLDQPQPACGSYTWQIPPQLSGAIQIRVQIVDLAGNEESQSSGTIVLAGDYAPAGSFEASGLRSAPASKATPSVNGGQIEAAAISALAESDRFALARQLFQRGNLYSQRLEWPQAAEAFGKAVMYDPDNVSARVNLANALFRQGQFQQAQAEYQRSLQLKPSQSSALFGLAQTQIALKQYAPAQQTLARLLEQDRRDWQAWLMHGNVAAQLGQQQVALTSWQRAANEQSPVRRLAMEKLEQTQGPYSREN